MRLLTQAIIFGFFSTTVSRAELLIDTSPVVQYSGGYGLSYRQSLGKKVAFLKNYDLTRTEGWFSIGSDAT